MNRSLRPRTPLPDPPKRSPPDRVILAAWLVWCAWVVAHYFIIPNSPFSWREPGELFPAPYAREATLRAFAAVCAAATVTMAAWAAGTLLLRRGSAMFAFRLERLVFELALGFGALSAACLLLAFAGWYRPAVVRTMTIALAASAVLPFLRARPPSTQACRTGWPQPRELLLVLCGVVACVFAAVGALAPETEYDALWYHLWLPAQWLAAGRPIDVLREYVSLYPSTWELLFGAAMTLGGPVGAKLLHYACLILLGVTAGLFSARWFPRSSGVAAAALVVTVPLTIWEGTTAYIDLALAWYVTASGYALVRHNETRDRRWLLLAAITMGIALAIKTLALIAFAITGLILFLASASRRGLLRPWAGSPGSSAPAPLAAREMAPACHARALRTCLLFGVIALAVPSPWYARAYLASGNPVFPDMYAVFGARPAERWDSEAERMLRAFKDRFGGDRSLQQAFALPWDVTMHGTRYGGTLGPVFLLLIPVALVAALRRGPARRPTLVLSAAIVAYALVWASPISSLQLRFLVPLVPFLAVLAEEGLRRLPPTAWFVTALLLVFNLPPFTEWHEADRRGWTGWLTHATRLLPVPVVVGAESQDHYLARTVPSYRAWRYIDTHVQPGARVLTFSGGDHLYSLADRVWSDAPIARAATWGTPAGREDAARAALGRLGITHVLFDRRQLTSGNVRTLAIASTAMRACCLEQVYEDDRFAVYRLR